MCAGWRHVIKAGNSTGIVGRIGRYCGRVIGWPLSSNLRVIIDNPAEYIQRQLLESGSYEPTITKLLKENLGPGDLFVDVGANIGYHTLVAASRGASVHAFEPVPRLVSHLKDNVRLNHLEDKVCVSPTALSNKNGFATFYIAKREDDGSHSLIEGVPAKSINSITVQILTLDAYIESVNCQAPTIIKVDVEGSEAWVLDGAVKLITVAHPLIIIETGDRLADRIGESAATVLCRLYDWGYRVFCIPEYEGELAEVRPATISGDLANYLACYKE